MRNKLSMGIMVAGLVTLGHAPVYAMGDQPVLALEEILVTAQKRVESTQNISATVNAISGESFAEFGIRELSDVEALTAGLSLTKSSNATSRISMRGVTYDPYSNATNAVQPYWNQIAIDSNVAFGQLFDIERMEVLRGPQGTLQGLTSPGGAIQIHTRTPNLDEFEANVSATAGDHDRVNSEVGVNMPLIEGQLAVRLAATYDENNLNDAASLVGGQDSEVRSRAQRISVNWQPAEDFNAQLFYQYGETSADKMTILAGSDELGHGYADLSATDRSNMAEEVALERSRNRLTSLNMDWQLADHTLSSVTGYQRTRLENHSDNDLANILDDESIFSSIFTDQEVFSQELRLASVGNESWDYLLGVYYGTRDTHTNPMQTQYIAIPNGMGPPATNYSVMGIVNNTLLETESSQLGIFTDHKFKINETSDIQIGLRWQKVDKYIAGNAYAAGQVIALFLPEDESSSQEAVTGNINYSYHLSDEIMLYTRLAKSFRPGGVTVTPTHEIGSENLKFGSESSIALELGFKSRLLDNRLQLNGSIYQQEFKDYIARVTGVRYDSTGDGLVDDTDKGIAGGLNYNTDTLITGAELEAMALISANLVGGLRLSYVDATFADGAQAPCNDQATVGGNVLAYCDVSDERVGGEPNWSVSANLEYSQDLGAMDWYLRGLYKYSDSRSNQVIDDADTGGYGLFDLYTGFRSDGAGWDVNVWAKNLLNKVAITSIGDEKSFRATGYVGAPNIADNSGYRMVQMANARSVGVTAKYNF